MATTDSLFAGSIPQLYDTLMVPMLFDSYAADMAGRVARLRPEYVLETAAGTGAVTRALVRALPATAQITATDLNQPMLTLAASHLPDQANVRWQQADAQSLPFPDDSFDVVVCQFGVMFFPDKPKGYAEAQRVLRPGGRFLFNTWDSVAGNAFVSVLANALTETFPDDPPTFMQRVPHGHFDTDAIRAALGDAGFASSTVETVEMTARATSAMSAATAYIQGTPIRAEIEARGGSLEDVTQKTATMLAATFGTGAIEGAIRAFVFTAIA